jgi:hypothetical protein
MGGRHALESAQLQHRYMQTEPMADLMPPLDQVPTQIATVAA